MIAAVDVAVRAHEDDLDEWGLLHDVACQVAADLSEAAEGPDCPRARRP